MDKECLNNPKGMEKRKRSIHIPKDIIEVANSHRWSDIRLPREVQLKRVKSVMEHELTEKQREVILLILEGHTQKEIAEDKGVCCSTICRTYHRGLTRLMRFTRY